jgi:hypothetical protein
VAADFVRLTVGQTVIDTEIAYIEAPYINLYYENTTRDGAISLNYIVADYTGMLTSYDDNGTERVRVTLPQGVGADGMYTLTLYSRRQQQRQALSQVLRPKADN